MVTVSSPVNARQVKSRSGACSRELLLALCTIAALLQPASCSAHNQVAQFLNNLPQLNASSRTADVEPLNLIVMLKDSATAASLQAICSRDQAAFAKRAAKLKMKGSCHLAGLCRHVYANYLTGMAGLFTPTELIRLGDCLPSNSISYIEQDLKVHKAEGPQPGQQPALPDQASRAVAASISSRSQLTARRLLRQASELAEGAETRRSTSASVPQSTVQAADGSSQQTTDPTLVKLTQAFMPASNLQAAGLSSAMYEGASSGVTPANAPPNTVQAANGPVPQNSSGATQYMAAGVKSQTLHTAQWNLDRVDQSSASLNQAYMFGSDSQVGTGRGVNIYTLDSGIRQSHQEFQAWQGATHRVSLGQDTNPKSPSLSSILSAPADGLLLCQGLSL